VTRYVKRRLETRDRAAAALTSLGVAAGVGLAAYYLIRIFLMREEVPERRVTETTDVVRS